jgi:hypothetical protein
MDKKPDYPHVNDPAIELLNQAIVADGRGVTRYALEFLFRDPSAIHRWRRGENKIPLAIRQMLSPNPLLEVEKTIKKDGA